MSRFIASPLKALDRARQSFRNDSGSQDALRLTSMIHSNAQPLVISHRNHSLDVVVARVGGRPKDDGALIDGAWSLARSPMTRHFASASRRRFCFIHDIRAGPLTDGRGAPSATHSALGNERTVRRMRSRKAGLQAANAGEQ
jgi:hypothetical protein